MAHTKRWHRDRQKTISASDAPPIVLGKDRFRTARDVMLEKLAAEPIRRPDGPDTTRGKALEHVAAQRAMKDLGIVLRKHGQTVASAVRSWMTATPDYEVTKVRKTCKQGIEVGDIFELKVPRSGSWRRMLLYGVPLEYHVQCLHQSWVCSKPVHFAALHPEEMNILYMPVPFSGNLMTLILEREADFWGMMQRGELPPEPEVEQPEPDKYAPQGGILTILTDEHTRRAALAFREADEIAKDAAQLCEDAKVRLIERMGEHDACEIPGLLRCYYRQQKGKTSFDSEAALAQDPSLKRFLRRGKPFRSFRPYILRGE